MTGIPRSLDPAVKPRGDGVEPNRGCLGLDRAGSDGYFVMPRLDRGIQAGGAPQGQFGLGRGVANESNRGQEIVESLTPAMGKNTGLC